MTVKIDLDYDDALTLWSSCKTEVDELRKVCANSPEYNFLRTEADKMERIMNTLEQAIDKALF